MSLLSPGVRTVEKDFTSVVPAVSTSAGATAGTFVWGPVMFPTIVSSENELRSVFGNPVDGNATSFFTASNFLSYSNNLLVCRTDNEDARNAVAIKTGGLDDIDVTNPGELYTIAPVVVIDAPDIDGGTQAVATAVLGTLDNEFTVIDIVITEPGSGYTIAPDVTIVAATGDSTGTGATATASITVAGIKINNVDHYEQNYINGAGVVGEFAAKYPGANGNALTVAMADHVSYEGWDYADEFNSAPETNELHVIILDRTGSITGTAGGVLEKFAYLSKASNGKRSDGSNAYYKNVLNNSSQWIYWMDHPEGMDWGKEDGDGVTFLTISSAIKRDMLGGVDDFATTDGEKMNAFALFDNFERYDISLIAVGKASIAVATFVISNVAEVREDCIAFVSPEDNSTGEVIIGTGTALAQKIVDFRNLLPSSSYAVIDSGYKYQYDRYNDVYRWVPLNGDIAGLCAQTDRTNDAWWSPGGYSRGQVKNVIKLAFNPNQIARDTLYKSNVNPVVSFPGEGTVLFGDKTMLSKPSAFDRINVRRLFIVLKKAISKAAKYQLFEFNDDVTRNQFKAMVEPFLRDVQGRRGLTSFKVVCDETNNTPHIIDTNQFLADIFIAPNRSINFITLSFNATRTGASFSELGG